MTWIAQLHTNSCTSYIYIYIYEEEKKEGHHHEFRISFLNEGCRVVNRSPDIIS